MQRRTILKTLNRLTLGTVAAIVFNPFETARSVVSFYSNALAETPLESPDAVARRTTDGTYRMRYGWTDRTAACWRLRVSVEQSAYDAASERSRGYLGAFDGARTNRHARRLAERLETAASTCRARDREPPGVERLERAVGFARSLEYAVDPASKGIPEYHRTVEETLVDGRGDCKDLTYLLAGVLSHPPFEYRTAMVFLPEHMLLGVHAVDLPAPYAGASTLPDCEYVAIESTSGEPIGEFRDDPVLAVYADGVEYFDCSAIAKTTGELLRDPSKSEFIANLRR